MTDSNKTKGAEARCKDPSAPAEPNALRERELAAFRERRERSGLAVTMGMLADFRAGWDRAWAKCSEVHGARIRELTAEIESYRRTISAEYSKREALDEELSQLGATVEQVADIDLSGDGEGPSNAELERICQVVVALRAALSAAPAPAAPNEYEQRAFALWQVDATHPRNQLPRRTAPAAPAEPHIQTSPFRHIAERSAAVSLECLRTERAEARVAELEAKHEECNDCETIDALKALVEELEGALNRVVQTTDSGSRASQIALEALDARK